ncbi:MAG: sulfurtransferase [Epsilonproteobacteria bacterium]|nr:sulfurtransferase [Campylobacterota bacterium]
MSESNNTIDINSEIFQKELEKTWKFIEKVNKEFGFVQNPDKEINDGVAMGLARNKLMYGKRYCPCFIVQGKTEEERKKADNRICPCKPALEKEIPNDGVCHCGLFCTPEYAQKKAKEKEVEEVVHTHSRGLSKDEALLLLQKEQLDGDEVEALLEARELGMVDFKLIDVREPMEYEMAHIKGTDELLPTSQFYNWIDKLIKMPEHIILYCHTGSRSYQVQHILKAQGKENVSNFTYGIITYPGEIIRGI